jgi:hypothetical protein
MTRLAILTATALLATTTIASADYRSHNHYGSGYGGSYGTSDIDRRQENQQKRIQHGVRTGEITRSEYQRLQAEQARIAELERRAKADGYLSASERAYLRSAQNEANRHIYQEKHDGEKRAHGYRPWWRWY